MDSSLLTAIITGVTGTAAGAIGAAVITTMSGRGQARADAAEMVTQAAGAMTDRLMRENTALRSGLSLITDVLDELIEDLDLQPDVREKLRAASRAAREATKVVV